MTTIPATTQTKQTANSARRALTVIGDRWTLLILRDAFLGVHQFGVWQTRLGVAPAVLTRRLKSLTENGILRRQRLKTVPPRIEYHLTKQGFDIHSIALMVLQWEQRWFKAPRGSAIVLRHLGCGQITEPRLTCGSCGAETSAREVRYESGPGAGAENINEKRMRRASITAADNRATHGFLEHAVDILGDRWGWEIVGAAFLGHKRFDDLQASTGMATNILSDRLRRLSADGILTRHPYQQNQLRYEYVLTAKGRDLFPAIVMLVRWGDRWLANAAGVPMLLFHKTCGGSLNPAVSCSSCGGTLDPHEMSYEFSDGSVGKALPRAG